MPLNSSLRSAFDRAIAAAIRAESANEKQSADPELAANLGRLREELIAARARAVESGHIDGRGLADQIRWVAEWAPANDVTLLGALGQIARAARTSKETR